MYSLASKTSSISFNRSADASVIILYTAGVK